MSLWIGGFVALTVFVTAILAATYNRLIGLDNHWRNSLAQIEVQLKRRSDLIPNLVECVRAHMAFEQQALESLMAARSEANRVRENAHQQPDNAGAVEEWLGAERDLGSALGRLWIALENYSELKARQSVADLTEQLTSTENRIAFARQAHNDWVTTFNAYRQAFPQCMVATLLGFSRDRKWLDASNPDKPATVWSTAILTPVERG